MKALDTIRFPKLKNLERDMHERQSDDVNQFRLNNNFKKIEDAIAETEETIDKVATEIRGEIPAMYDYVEDFVWNPTYKYRAWNSGFSEMWIRSLKLTKAITTAVGSLYKATASIELPSGVFTSVATCTCTIETESTNGCWAVVTGLSTSQVDLMLLSADSATIDLYCHLHITGEWK